MKKILSVLILSWVGVSFAQFGVNIYPESYVKKAELDNTKLQIQIMKDRLEKEIIRAAHNEPISISIGEAEALLRTLEKAEYQIDILDHEDQRKKKYFSAVFKLWVGAVLIAGSNLAKVYGKQRLTMLLSISSLGLTSYGIAELLSVPLKSSRFRDIDMVADGTANLSDYPPETQIKFIQENRFVRARVKRAISDMNQLIHILESEDACLEPLKN